MVEMKEETFNQIEEVGYRIKASRVKNKLRASAVSQGRVFAELHPNDTAPTMTSSSYTNVEKGKGSLLSLKIASELAGVEIIVTANYSVQNSPNVNPVHTQLTTDILGLHDLAKKVRQEKLISISELSKAAGTTYSSVVVFEKTDKPTIYSTSRYLEAMGVKIELRIVDIRDGKAINPSLDMPIIRYEKLVEEFEEFLATQSDAPKTVEHSTLSPSVAPEAPESEDKDFMQEIGVKLKELRLKAGLSRVKLASQVESSEIMIMQVENGKSSLVSANLIAEAFQKKIVITLTGKTIREAVKKGNDIKSQKIEVEEITQILDELRKIENYTVSDFAKKIGTTYRSVDIFPTVVPHKKSLIRYIDGLGLRAKLTLVKK